MRVVILVPRRDGVRDRDILWAWTRSWWQRNYPDWPIFEGHHDDGPFNRSAAVNRAAGSADWQQAKAWDVGVIIDSDVICDPERVRRSVEVAAKTGRLTIPFDVRHDLNPNGTERVMAGYDGPWNRFIHRTYTDMVSSVIAVPRRLWDAVGGFDEAFSGWGFEDNAFAAACETFGGPVERIHGDLWHLYHQPAREGKRGTATHMRNKALADKYLAVRGDRAATLALRAGAPLAYENHPAGIPRILHRVVPERIDPTAERWWSEFERIHTDWEFRTHRDPLTPSEWPETSPYWDRCRNGAELADLVRLEALLRWGGIYVDEDVEPFRSLEPLLPLSAFAAWEDERTVPNAVMGAVPGHPAIRACLDLAIERIDLPTWDRGPGVTTAILPGRHDVLLFPPGTFYAVHYRDPDRDRLMADRTLAKRNPWAFVLHHYAGSWLKAGAA